MAVKTITIDMEAYELLAADKGPKESFSRVIKRRFHKARTARDLLAHLDEICLSDETLDRVEELVKDRAKSPARSPTL